MTALEQMGLDLAKAVLVESTADGCACRGVDCEECGGCEGCSCDEIPAEAIELACEYMDEARRCGAKPHEVLP